MSLNLYFNTPLFSHNHHNHRHNHRTTTLTPPHSTVPTTTTTNLSTNLQNQTLETLEWNRLCTHLSPFTSTTMGLSLTQTGSIPMGRTLNEAQKLLAQTTAALDLLPIELDFSGVVDVSGIVKLGEKDGDFTVLTIGEICLVRKMLVSARRLFEQLKEVNSINGGRFHPLLEILQNCNFLSKLEQKIQFCLDCKLRIVLDRASDELTFIRLERKKNVDTLNTLLRNISNQIFQSGGIDQPIITSRRSRMCVGIKPSHRSLLQGGVVLDSSSSGATYFIEPKEVVDLNNMEVFLANSEKEEELSILSMISFELRNSAEDIIELLDRIQEIDLAIARARYANLLGGVCPILNLNTYDDDLLVDVEGIRHPLLLEPCLARLKEIPGLDSGKLGDSHTEAGIADSIDTDDGVDKLPVAIDIKIGSKTSVVIISGPNAGGKTASMKTLGLASLMSKAGLYIPAKSVAKLPWFDFVLADIGDQQSLEQSLSTFSGHISRINNILRVATKDTLVLIDEIGSGTDPSEGVALSRSILNYLKDRVGLAIITTHYADLTRLRDLDSQFENAGMEFSLETLQPTYKVLWGSCGESNALKIARRIGFDDMIIDRAERWLEKLMPEKQARRKGLLYESLLEEREKMGERARRASSLYSDVMELYRELEEETRDLNFREKALISKETHQIEQQLDLVKSKIETIIQDFENQLQISDINEYGSLVKKAESSIGSLVKSLVKSLGPISDDFSEESEVLYTPQVGEKVCVKRFGGKLATVVEVSEKDESVIVQYGKVRFRVDKNGIQPIEKSGAGSCSYMRKKAQISQNLNNLSAKNNDEQSYGPIIQTSKNTVDLRGMRVEEASQVLSMAIATRESHSILFIIHGMGTGILKEQVIEMLKNHPRIEKFEQESPMNYGCTIAFIK